MHLTIKSKTLGKEITFSRPGSSYIYADLNGLPGTLGQQICCHGQLMGNTLCYDGNDESEFARICRGWLRAYIRRGKVSLEPPFPVPPLSR